MSILWFLLAISVAFMRSIRDVLSKKFLKESDEYWLSFGTRFFTGIFTVPLLLIGFPKLSMEFFFIVFTYSLINAIATILLMKAIKYSEISLSMPMLTFTPALMLLTSPIILNEFPSILGVLGILLIVTGAYTLNISKRKISFLEPLKTITKEKGTRYALFVAIMWSISANLDKKGVLLSSPILWVVASNILIGILISPTLRISNGKRTMKPVFLIAFIAMLSLITQMYAMLLTLASYVISIKRFSVVFSVIFGYLIFKEKNVRERILGSFLMVIGTILILLFS